MECLELSSTSFVFLSSGNEKLAKGLLSEVSRVNLSVEVMRDIVHQERLEFPLEPEHAFLGLHVYVQRAQYALTLGVDVLLDMEVGHVDRYAYPVEELLITQRLRTDSGRLLSCRDRVQLCVVDCEVSLELLHVELEVVALRELAELLNEKHRVILLARHKQVVIGKSHQQIQFLGVVTSSQEAKDILLQIGIVEGGEDVRDAKALGDALGLSILLLVESDVVVAADLDHWVEQLALLVLSALLLLHDHRPLNVQVIELIL